MDKQTASSLAQRLSGDKAQKQNDGQLRVREGTVISTQVDGTITVFIGGATLTGIRCIGPVIVGESALFLAQGTFLVCIGHISNSGIGTSITGIVPGYTNNLAVDKTTNDPNDQVWLQGTFTPISSSVRLEIDTSVYITGTGYSGLIMNYSQTVSFPLHTDQLTTGSPVYPGVTRLAVKGEAAGGESGAAVSFSSAITLTGLTPGVPVNYEIEPLALGGGGRFRLPEVLYGFIVGFYGDVAYALGATTGTIYKIITAKNSTNTRHMLDPITAKVYPPYAVDGIATASLRQFNGSDGVLNPELWLCTWLNGKIEIRDPKTLKLSATLTTSGFQPFSIDIVYPTNSIWVSDYGNKTIRRIIWSTRAFSSNFAMPAGLTPYRLKVDPSGTKIAIIALDASNVQHLVIMDASTGSILFNTLLGTTSATTGRPQWESSGTAIWVNIKAANKLRRIVATTGVIDTPNDITFTEPLDIAIAGNTLYAVGTGSAGSLDPTWGYFSLNHPGAPKPMYDKQLTFNNGFGGFSIMAMGPDQQGYMIPAALSTGVSPTSPLVGIAPVSFLGITMYCRPSNPSAFEYLNLRGYGAI